VYPKEIAHLSIIIFYISKEKEKEKEKQRLLRGITVFLNG
jgi:hypothetical protein